MWELPVRLRMLRASEGTPATPLPRGQAAVTPEEAMVLVRVVELPAAGWEAGRAHRRSAGRGCSNWLEQKPCASAGAASLPFNFVFSLLQVPGRFPQRTGFQKQVGPMHLQSQCSELHSDVAPDHLSPGCDPAWPLIICPPAVTPAWPLIICPPGCDPRKAPDHMSSLSVTTA